MRGYQITITDEEDADHFSYLCGSNIEYVW